MINKKYLFIAICIIILIIFYIKKDIDNEKAYQDDTQSLSYDKPNNKIETKKKQSIDIEYKHLFSDKKTNEINKINTKHIDYQKQEYEKYQQNIKYELNKKEKLNNIKKIQEDKKNKELRFRKKYEEYDKIKQEQDNVLMIKKRQIQDNTDKEMMKTIKKHNN